MVRFFIYFGGRAKRKNDPEDFGLNTWKNRAVTEIGKVASGPVFILLFWVLVVKYQEPNLGHAKFGVFIRYPSGNVEWEDE